MEKKTLAYGKIVKILCLLSGIISLIIGFALLFFGLPIGNYFVYGNGFDPNASFIKMLYFIAMVIILLSVLLIIAGLKSPVSKGWNIFIVIFMSFSSISSLLVTNLFGFIFATAISVLVF